MNKSGILFLGALVAMGMVACDDKLPVAPPQANEQGPVLEGFEGAYATLLETTINLPNIDAGAESEAMPAAVDDVLTIYTVEAGTSGLPQQDIFGALEISNTSDFAESIVLQEVDGMVGTVSLAALQEAHIQLFGVSPEAKTVYYRVPLYANVGGSVYRLNSLDSYGDVGTYNETYDPGFTIDSTYYIIGIESWDAGSEVEMSHAEGVSVYDDPTFTYSFTSEETVYWKIVTPEVHAEVGGAGFDANTSFWPLLYRGIPYDDSDYEGTLVQEDGDAPSIPAGDWTITINMKDYTYSVSGTPAVGAGDPSGIYMRGSWSDSWDAMPAYEFLGTTEDGVYVVPFVTLAADTKFKVADADWSGVNLGGEDGAVITPNQEFALNGGSDITLSVDFTGAAILKKANGSYTLLLQTFEAETAGTGAGFYLRGALNDWGADAAYEFKTTTYKNVWELANQNIVASTEEASNGFKIADADWSTINYGGPQGFSAAEKPVVGLAYNGGDMTLSADFKGTLRVVSILDSYYLLFVPAN